MSSGTLRTPAAAALAVATSVDAGCDELARIIATADGFQSTAEEPVAVHHYANVLFNVLRGGIFHDQYRVPAADFARSVRHSNARVHERHRGLLDGLHETLAMEDLLSAVQRTGDPQLERLCYEYLPITFGRRHGDPSRPWNKFAIRLKDARGERAAVLRGQLAGHLPELGGADFQLPGVHRVRHRQVRQRLDRGRIQPVSHHPGRNRLGGRGTGQSMESHRLLGRPPGHLSAEVPGTVPAVSSGTPQRAAAPARLQLCKRALSDQVLRGNRRGPEEDRGL